MKILVVGAGATGGFFGALLARAGRDVTFLVRPHRAAVLRERGLRLTGTGGDEVITPNLVTADELAGPYDLILLSVKSTALKQAIDDLAPAVGPETVIVPLLNGLRHVDELTARFGTGPVLGGVAKVITTLNDEGDIVRLAPLAVLTIGEPDGSASPRTEAVRAVLADAGIDASVAPDILASMWRKWVFITTLSTVTCLMRSEVGDVNAVPGGSELGPAVVAEAAAVSAAAGYPVPESEIATTSALVTQTDSAFASSMYRDLVAGRPTEVEHIFGDLVTRARALSVPTPLLDLATLHLRVHQRRVEAKRQAERLG
ncbi:ketopantoate reductase family protein [Streptomyces sp. NPDC020719]|uniref:ketopantoate reductase family protein n=1 Tax=Streptomyces sp. NPDC020719 TaxID=3154896 RepID=UPI0033CB8012